MNSLVTLVNIVCTEAFEYGGIPEVPDDKHGAAQNYAAFKRDARGDHHQIVPSRAAASEPSFQYDAELVRQDDGTLNWVE